MPLSTELLQTSNLPLGQQLSLLKSDGTTLLMQVVQGSQSNLNPQAATLQGTIIVDPQNVSGVASDSNPPTATVGAFTGPVFRTWAGLVAAWGTFAPLLTQATTIVFASNHTDNTDPVVWWPIIARGVQVTFRTTGPTVVTNGVALAGTTAKNRAAGANSPLITTLGATGAVGQLVQNTTHASNAWASKALGGNSFRMWQPMVAAAVGGTTTPAEVDTWANVDNVNLVSPIQVNIASVQPTLVDGLGSLAFYQVCFFDPGGVGADQVSAVCDAGNVSFIECSFQRILALSANTVVATTFVNCFLQGGLTALGRITLNGGGMGATSLAFTVTNIGDNFCVVDGDFGLSSAATMLINGGQVVFGQVFFDQNITIENAVLAFQTVAYGGHTLYSVAGDAHTLNFIGFAHGFNATGTFVAALTAPGVVAGINLNGAATGSSITGAGAINQGIAVTPANLDAAAGAAGFGGNAFNFGGASISNKN